MAMTAEPLIQGVSGLLVPMLQQMQHLETAPTQLLQNTVERPVRESTARG